MPSGYVHAGRRPSSRDIPVTYLPRTIYVRSGDEPGESTARETFSPHRPPVAHQVAGHVRQIPADWRASDAARIAAQESGMPLPTSGFTFVRPHVRGHGEAPSVHRARVRGRK